MPVFHVNENPVHTTLSQYRPSLSFLIHTNLIKGYSPLQKTTVQGAIFITLYWRSGHNSKEAHCRELRTLAWAKKAHALPPSFWFLLHFWPKCSGQVQLDVLYKYLAFLVPTLQVKLPLGFRKTKWLYFNKRILYCEGGHNIVSQIWWLNNRNVFFLSSESRSFEINSGFYSASRWPPPHCGLHPSFFSLLCVY